MLLALVLAGLVWAGTYNYEQRVMVVTQVTVEPLRKPVSTLNNNFKNYESWPLRFYLAEAAAVLNVDAQLAWRIIWCESNGQWFAKSTTSTAKGLFQIIDGTWAITPQGRAGKSPLDPYENINAGLWLLSQPNGITHWRITAWCWGSF